MHAGVIHHYEKGSSYPRGGSSEFAFHLIPAIEKAGGRVLVRAPVSEFIVKHDKVVGELMLLHLGHVYGSVDIFG